MSVKQLPFIFIFVVVLLLVVSYGGDAANLNPFRNCTLVFLGTKYLELGYRLIFEVVKGFHQSCRDTCLFGAFSPKQRFPRAKENSTPIDCTTLG